MAILTETQIAIIVDLANGLSIEDITKKRYISKSTVNKHLLSARKKLEAKNNTHLVARCIYMNLIAWKDE